MNVEVTTVSKRPQKLSEVASAVFVITQKYPTIRRNKLMGGSITIESKLGIGTQFFIDLCLPKASVKLADPLPASKFKGVHALIVDDNQTNREILINQLNDWHMRVQCAPSGKKAHILVNWAIEDKLPFQLAILDMHMSGMNGLQLGGSPRNMTKIAFP